MSIFSVLGYPKSTMDARSWILEIRKEPHNVGVPRFEELKGLT